MQLYWGLLDGKAPLSHQTDPQVQENRVVVIHYLHKHLQPRCSKAFKETCTAYITDCVFGLAHILINSEPACTSLIYNEALHHTNPLVTWSRTHTDQYSICGRENETGRYSSCTLIPSWQIQFLPQPCNNTQHITRIVSRLVSTWPVSKFQVRLAGALGLTERVG